MSKRDSRVALFKETCHIFDSRVMKFPSSDGGDIEIDRKKYNDSLTNSKKIRIDDTLKKIEGKKLNIYEDADTKIIYLDTVGCGIKLIKEGYNPVILNMASDKAPGGGVTRGSSAQEESLCIQGGLYDPLMKFNKYYPWEKNNIEGFYHPNVPFIRDVNFAFLDKPYYMGVISMAMLRHKIKAKTNTSRGTEAYNVIYNKIDTFLATAYLYGHDAVVLGAWGCGAFGNDPVKVSQIFKDVIKDKYSKTFERILFGIVDNEKSDNYTVFKKTFAPKTTYKAPTRGDAWKPTTDTVVKESSSSYLSAAKRSGMRVGLKGASLRTEVPVFEKDEALPIISVEEQEKNKDEQKAERKARKKAKKKCKGEISFDFLG